MFSTSLSPTTVARLTLASLVANVVIVVTGGAVRLTGSGLGCPTWPGCTDDSYVATAEMGVYGAIEFGNRLVSIVVGAIAVAVVLAVAYGLRWHPRMRRHLLRPALGVLGLVLLQGLIGGISVRVHLNPWVVAAHFLLSMVLLAVAHTLWRRAAWFAAGGPAVQACPAPVRSLAGLLTGVSFVVLALGAVVTGSGPHSGDADAGRTGLDPEMISQVHVDAVFLLLGLSVALWFTLRAVGAPAADRPRRRGADRGGALPGTDRLHAVRHPAPGTAGRGAHARRLPGLAGHAVRAVGRAGARRSARCHRGGRPAARPLPVDHACPRRSWANRGELISPCPDLRTARRATP